MAVSVDRKSVPDAGGDRKRGEYGRGQKAERIAHAENAQRCQRAVDENTVRGGIPKRRERLTQ